MIVCEYSAPDFEPGTVWLVGAGPGDPGLLSLHAVHALQNADVIVHDALVSAEILSIAAADAAVENVGKRGGRPSSRQTEISARLVELARQGKRVLRLKGGDPFVFGRGVDEALVLAKENIPYRIVPGITAGIGGLAYAGIPATHGAMNQSVTLITGHDSSGEIPGGIDWQAVANGCEVLVLYMAIRHMPAIAARLVAAGRDKREPVAFVRNATMAKQQVLETTLAGVSDVVASKLVASPSIVVIGPVVSLRKTLAWFDETALPVEA